MWGRGGRWGVPATERSLTENQVSPTLWSQASSSQNGERVHAYYVSCLCRGASCGSHRQFMPQASRKSKGKYPLDLSLTLKNTLENSSRRIHWRNPDKCWWLAKIRKKKSPRNQRRLVLYSDDRRGFFPCAKIFIVWCSWQWQGLPPSSGQLGTLRP